VAGRARGRGLSTLELGTLAGGTRALLIQPTDRLSITVGVHASALTQGGPNTIDSPPLTETHYQPFDVAEPFADKFDLYTH
jgi:hypothetical protein